MKKILFTFLLIGMGYSAQAQTSSVQISYFTATVSGTEGRYANYRSGTTDEGCYTLYSSVQNTIYTWETGDTTLGVSVNGAAEQQVPISATVLAALPTTFGTTSNYAIEVNTDGTLISGKLPVAQDN